MASKNSFVTQCYKVSDDLNIPKTRVSEILYAYISELKFDIQGHKGVRLLGLVYITNGANNLYDTTALYARRVSEKTSLPLVTCITVVKYYLKYLKQELSRGMDVDIRSLFTIHVVRDRDLSKVVYHSSLAECLRQTCPNARVHTCKYLKRDVV